jgi:HEAT repeat protein
MALETETKVRRLLRPTHDVERWHAEIKTLQAEEAVPLLASAMNDLSETNQARYQAAAILGILGQITAVPALLQALESPEPVLRGQAAQSLGEIANLPKEALAALIQHLEDADYFVRKCSAIALQQIKRPEALLALEHMRDHDPVPNNRELAQEAIRAIKGAR